MMKLHTSDANKKPCILIVDDSGMIRNALKRELVKLGFEVKAANDGHQALQIAAQQPFDLIITDIEMPRMDGFELCEQLKHNAQTQTIPVVMLSSHDSDEAIERGFKVGAAAFITKANARQELGTRIEDVLNRALFLRDRLVLVVDDSKLVLSIARKGLAQAGFKVATAENGARALEFLKKNKPDLILCDLHMPEVDGAQLCAALRSNSAWSGIPFVLMSTAGERGVIRRMLERGACGYIEKPFNVEQLVIMTEKLLSDHFQLLLKEKERLDTERNLMIASITSLVQALEARDVYTRGHSEMVADLSVAMATEMGFDDDELQTMRMAARLHDLGKIGVRDDVLLKPGRLTDAEFSLIQRHPVIGAEILGPIPSLESIIPGVLYHHERMGGQGYPEGLKGSSIPLMARIIAVADTYDSITSERPYQAKTGKQQALQIIDSLSGDQLCPDCVRVFLRCIT
jgi:putative two-component system response regulator